MHLTLVFLGEVAEDRLASIVGALSELDITPFEIRITGFDTFPRAGALFAEVDPSPRLLHLQAQVAERMVGCGFVPESRPYHPHITLARLRSQLRINRSQFVRISGVRQSFRMEAVNLYRSRQTARGSSYDILAQMPGSRS
jgi:2'-5' RNA ligase